MRILSEQTNPVTYEMRDIVKKILQVLKEDQSLDFGPRLKSSVVNKKTIQDAIKSKRQLIKKSQETYADLERKLHDLKKANDNIREELLESLGSEL